ncbi:hypothetical protein HDU92_004011 [Lobulomyces angularis]|nr:hypothetical protein HDU92_004011 [Lobulomyces angularis]
MKKVASILHLLGVYLSNKQINQTTKNAATLNFIISDDEFIPIAYFQTLKAMKKYKVDEILESIKFSNNIFELNVDKTCLRRTRPFDDFNIEAVEIENSSSTKRENILVSFGFPEYANLDDVILLFSNFGEVHDVSAFNSKDFTEYYNSSDNKIINDEEELHRKRNGKSYKVKFATMDSLISALINQHYFEGLKIWVRPYIEEINSENEILNLLPSHLKKGKTDYPLNRVVYFDLKFLDMNLQLKKKIKLLLEKFAPIVLIDYDYIPNFGFCRLKTSVADLICDLINKEGGLILDEINIPVKLMQGKEEKLYWKVSKEREKKKSVQNLHIRKRLLNSSRGVNNSLNKKNRGIKRSTENWIDETLSSPVEEIYAEGRKENNRKRISTDLNQGKLIFNEKRKPLRGKRLKLFENIKKKEDTQIFNNLLTSFSKLDV